MTVSGVSLTGAASPWQDYTKRLTQRVNQLDHAARFGTRGQHDNGMHETAEAALMGETLLKRGERAVVYNLDKAVKPLNDMGIGLLSGGNDSANSALNLSSSFSAFPKPEASLSGIKEISKWAGTGTLETIKRDLNGTYGAWPRAITGLFLVLSTFSIFRNTFRAANNAKIKGQSPVVEGIKTFAVETAKFAANSVVGSVAFFLGSSLLKGNSLAWLAGTAASVAVGTISSTALNTIAPTPEALVHGELADNLLLKAANYIA